MASITSSLMTQLTRRPEKLRLLLGLVQRLRPVARFGPTFLVLGHAEVREVLERTDEFEYTPDVRRATLLGDFLVGLDDQPANLREDRLNRQVLDALFDRKLEPAIKAALESVEKRLRDLANGRIPRDLVGDLAEPFLIGFAEHFFGVPAPTDVRSRVIASDDPVRILALWVRKSGALLLAPVPAPFGQQRVGEACVVELRQYLSRVVCRAEATLEARRKRSTTALTLADANNVLEGLLIGLHDMASAGTAPTRDQIVPAVVRMLGGLLQAANPTVIKTFVNATEHLLETGRQFTAEGIRSDAGRQVLLEALRFRPTFPMLARHCPRTAELAAGSSCQTTVPAGATVVVSPMAAMFDPRAIEQPDVFSHERAPADYLIFGHGGHRCPGDRIGLRLVQSLLAWLAEQGFFSNPKTYKMVFDGAAVDAYKMVQA
ncbi:MAG: cytochrome P450 [Burkholderiaceae bacterium]